MLSPEDTLALIELMTANADKDSDEADSEGISETAAYYEGFADREVNLQRSPFYNGYKIHCPAGHEYTPENTYVNAGKRRCRECARVRDQQRYRPSSHRARQRIAA